MGEMTSKLTPIPEDFQVEVEELSSYSAEKWQKITSEWTGANQLIVVFLRNKAVQDRVKAGYKFIDLANEDLSEDKGFFILQALISFLPDNVLDTMISTFPEEIKAHRKQK